MSEHAGYFDQTMRKMAIHADAEKCRLIGGIVAFVGTHLRVDPSEEEIARALLERGVRRSSYGQYGRARRRRPDPITIYARRFPESLGLYIVDRSRMGDIEELIKNLAQLNDPKNRDKTAFIDSLPKVWIDLSESESRKDLVKNGRRW